MGRINTAAKKQPVNPRPATILFPAPAPDPRAEWPELISAPQLAKMTISPPVEIIEGLLYEGLGILMGGQKSGKSYIALSLGLAVAAGQPAFGSLKTKQGTVLYLALEDNHGRLQTRMNKVLAGKAEPSSLEFATTWNRLNMGGHERILKFLDWRPDTKLIIADVWSKIRPVSRGTGSQYDIDYEAIGPVHRLSLDRHISFLMIHHHKKNSKSEDFVNDASGTAALTGAADAICSFRRSKDTGTLQVKGREIEEKTMTLEYKRETWSWEYKGLDGQTPAGNGVRGELEEELMKNPGKIYSIAEIAEIIKRREDHVRVELGRLVTDGRAVRPKRGGYQAATL